jgi:hypothetical protein
LRNSLSITGVSTAVPYRFTMLNYRRKAAGVRIVCIHARMLDWRRMNLDRKLTTDDLIKAPDLLYVGEGKDAVNSGMASSCRFTGAP